MGSVDYKFGRKNQWRREVWNEIARRVPNVIDEGKLVRKVAAARAIRTMRQSGHLPHQPYR